MSSDLREREKERERASSFRSSARCSKMKEACERENQLRKAEEEEEHDEKKKKKMKSETGMREVCPRAAATCKTTLGRAIYRGPSPARYRFNFKLKFMNGLLPFCRIRLRTFSGPLRFSLAATSRLLPSTCLSVASRTFI